MKERSYSIKGNTPLFKHKTLCCVLVLAMVLLFSSPSIAKQFGLFGGTMDVTGYINQGVAYGISGDHYDTKKGFQQAQLQFLLETSYKATPELSFFASGMANADLAYNILDSNSEWKDKHFDKSRSENAFFSDPEDILKELHVTWSPGNFIFRLGKQIVKWGETDGTRLTDQINPQDLRRGITDVEFESTIIPIWLAKIEYWFEMDSPVVTDLGIELIFNPNAQFISDKSGLGNDVGGIWGPDIHASIGGPYPADFMYLGSTSATSNNVEPDEWDSDGFEFGVRVRAIVNNTIISLIYFDGVANAPVTTAGGPPGPFTFADDGRMVLHPTLMGSYYDFKYAGFTLTRDFEKLYIRALGGVAPVLRFESLYAFDTTFGNPMNGVEEHDEFRWAVGLDWKVKIPFLNPRAYYSISSQFISESVLDYPSYQLTKDEDNHSTSLLISTSFLHNKLAPSFFWKHDFTNDADLNIVKVTYEYTHNWNYTLGVLWVDGDKEGKGVEIFDNKDHVFFTIAYRF